MATRIKVPKPRNAGTMTESQFWLWIRYALRRKTLHWKPIRLVLEKAKRPSQSTNARLKWEYQCSMCKEWFPKSEISVDHITPAGSLTNGDDLKNFVNNLFCEENGLRVLCEEKCHKSITYVKKEE